MYLHMLTRPSALSTLRIGFDTQVKADCNGVGDKGIPNSKPDKTLPTKTESAKNGQCG